MKPKALLEKDWSKMLRKYSELNLKSWGYLDGLKKMSILRGAQIQIPYFPIFGQDYLLNYPKNIYMDRKIILNPTTLNTIRHMALDERREIGGTIEENKINVLFTGSNDRINLNINDQKTQSLFHTHPADEDVQWDPPSVLDIVSFLALTVKSIADYILQNKKDIKNMLLVENSLVFTKNEVYVYYISYPLMLNISKHLLEMKEVEDVIEDRKDFIYEVEKLLEEIELYYSHILSKYNMSLNEKQLEEYLSELSTLGILVKRFKYTDSPEVYVF
tara:strand:+ start:4422 stop:5243 length:822 start_codon:yes stop_codon:yes gene_type:complete